MFPMVSRIQLLQDYKEDPYPSKYSLIQLCYVWFYSTCIYEEFVSDPIITDSQHKNLTIFLKFRYSELPGPFRNNVAKEALSPNAHKLINWHGGLAFMVYKDCEEYSKIVSWRLPHAV